MERLYLITDVSSKQCELLQEKQWDALERINYKGIKLMDQIQRSSGIMVKSMKERITFGEIQFGFVLRLGNTNAFFLVQKWWEKFLTQNKIS